MSVDVIGDTSVKSFTFAAMGGGVVSSTATGFSADSQLISIVRRTLGATGTAGVPAAKFVVPSVAFTGGPPATVVATAPSALILYSSSATDTSVYTAYWVDSVQNSDYFAASSGVGQLFAP